jgi:asparagine synthase (glutamine-hydrolysing)
VCGVAAVLGAPEPGSAVARMIATMLHRGPDGAGVHVFGAGALGMCRLRVRRPGQLALPPVSAGVRVAYNGEVYGTLPASGGPVERVDDELALLGGPLERVDGMWALARPHAGGLALTRDRWGIRPLYYRPVANGWAVASEVPALIDAFGGVGASIDPVAEMLAFGAPLSADTVLQEIHAVPPGTIVELTGDRRVVSPWTDGDDKEAVPDTRPRCPLERLDSALSVSVERNLAAERPVGLALSGGLDSTLLADTLLRLGRRDLVSVSVLVDDAGGDGVRSAVELLGPAAAALGWRHRTTSVSADRYLLLLEKVVQAMGYPTRMSSAPLYLALAEVAARAGVVVLLTGEGADELFLGYQSYTRYFDNPEGAALDRLERLHFPERRRAYLARLAGEAQVRRCRELYRETARGALQAPGGPLRALEQSISLRPLLERADVCLMSRGVEGRSPFLHGDVPTVAASFAESDLVSEGIGKRPLRRLAEARRGTHAGSTAKRPFRAPIRQWLCRQDAAWSATVRKRVRSACRKLDFAETTADAIVDAAHLEDEAAGLVGALLAVDAWEAVA